MKEGCIVETEGTDCGIDKKDLRIGQDQKGGFHLLFKENLTLTFLLLID
jgi:hypothetical protein